MARRIGSENDAVMGLAIAEHIEIKAPLSFAMEAQKTERQHMDAVLNGGKDIQRAALARLKAQKQARKWWQIWK